MPAREKARRHDEADRPAFQQLMADVEEGKVDVIVVYKVDRLSRSLLDFVKVMERLNAAGVSFVSVTQNFSTADAMGRLTMNMLMSFAEFEREMISERTRDKIAMSRRKGRWTGGPVPYGYTTKEKRLVHHELEAATVREAFDLYVEHRQLAFVATRLNEEGKLPRGSRMKEGSPLRWTSSSLGPVLRNPIYAGLIMCGEEVVQGQHPAIVDGALFQRVQRILEGNERDLKFHGVNHDYVLRGLLKCGLCKQAMTTASTRHARKSYRYYRCSRKDKHGPSECGAAPLSAEAIEGYVVDQLAAAGLDGALGRQVETELLARLKARRAELKEARAKLPGPIATHSANAARLVEELTRLEGRARELVEAKLNTETQKLGAAEQQLAEAERALERVESAERETRGVIAALQDFKEVWEMMTPENRGRMLRALVDRVEVDRRSGRAEIHLVDFAADPEVGSASTGAGAEEAE